MHKKLLFIFLYCLGASGASAAPIQANSPSFADVKAAILGGQDTANPPNTFAAAGDGDTVQIPAGEATWVAGQTIIINKAVSVIGAGTVDTPSNPMTTSSTWGTRINLSDRAFIWNLTPTAARPHGSEFTTRLSGIHFHYVNLASAPLEFDNTSRCWVDTNAGGVVRGGVRIDHIMWTAGYGLYTTPPTNHLAYTYTNSAGGAGTGTGAVLDFTFANVPQSASATKNTTSASDVVIVNAGSGYKDTPPDVFTVTNGTSTVPVKLIVKKVNGVTNPQTLPVGAILAITHPCDSDKFNLRGWICGVMDHCFINFITDGSWGFASETTNLSTSGSPTGNASSPVDTPGGFGTNGGLSGFGHWSWFGKCEWGHNIPNGDGTHVTALDDHFLTDTSGDTFYYEDNVMNMTGLLWDALEGGTRRVVRHNTSPSMCTEHGNDSGSVPGTHFSEEYNNKWIQSQAAINAGGGTWKKGNRGGVKIMYNELHQGYGTGLAGGKFISSTSSYRLNGDASFAGPGDGTNFWDQNYNEGLFGPLSFTPIGATGGPYNYSANSVPSFDTTVTTATVGGVANVPTDTRVGTVYAKSPASPNNIKNGGSIQLKGLVGAANQWRGFMIRNFTTSPPIFPGTQDNKQFQTFSMIQTNTANSDPNGSSTITVGADHGSRTLAIGLTDQWEIRYVKNFICIQGSGRMAFPFNGKQLGSTAGQTFLGPMLLAKNSPSGTAPTGVNNPKYPDSEVLGCWLWSVAGRGTSTASFANIVNFTDPSLTGPQKLQHVFWLGGWHENDSGFAGADGNGAPVAVSGRPTYPSRTGTAAEKRIGASWDGDTAPPLAGSGTRYLGPNGSGPAPGADLSSWKVYGSQYPHPLTGALSPPSFTVTSPQSIAIGTTGTLDITANGNPVPTVTKTSVTNPPSPITYADGGTNAGYGRFTWTTAPTSTSSTNFTFTATNSQGTATLNPLTLNVVNAGTAPQITSQDNTAFTVNSGGTFTVTASGTAPVTLSESGPLPQGVSFNASTGVLSGTATTTTGSPWNQIVFTAQNAYGTDTQPFTLTVNPANTAPAFTSANSTNFTAGTAGSFSVTASGTTPITFGLAPGSTLPANVSLSTAGALTSTSTAAAGIYTFTIRATNSIGNTDQAFTLTIQTVRTTPKPPPTGVYIFSSHYVGQTGTPWTAAGDIGPAIDNANCDGARVNVKWSDIETAPDNYVWPPLDAAVEYCRNTPGGHHKKIGIMVNAGRNSPLVAPNNWLSQPPYSVVPYTIQDTGFFAPGTTPDIRDPSYSTPVTGYLARWQKFVQALAAKYDGDDTVSFIIPTGIAFDDQWLMNGPLDTTALGNTGVKVAAWKTYAKQVLDFYAASFPRTTLANLQREPFSMTTPYNNGTNAAENPVTTMKAVSDVAATTYGCRWGYGFAPLTKDTTAANSPSANEMFLHWQSNPTHCETDTAAPTGSTGVTQVTGEMDAAVALKVRCMELYRAEMERGGVGGDLESTITSHRLTILAIPGCSTVVAGPTPPSIIQIAP